MALQFKNKRKITSKNYKTLSPVHLQQMAICATTGFGEKYTTPEHFLEQCGDGKIEEGYALLFDIVDSKAKNKVLYECWLYMYDETANVFFVDTTTDVNVGMSQSFFEDYTNGENEVLVEDLQDAYNKVI